MRKILILALLTAILRVSGPVLAQEQAREAAAGPPVAVPYTPCPAPFNLTLNATTPNVFSGDFTPAQLANQVGLNYPERDKHFLHTFQWKPQHRCCQITKAVLTVKMKANQSGQSANSPDAGNDAINVMHLQSSVTPPSQLVYSSLPFPAGQLVTKTLSLPATVLANINANNRLSIDIQDDTAVQSATLQLIGCCLRN